MKSVAEFSNAIVGCVEQVSCKKILGWVRDEQNPHDQLTVYYTDDGGNILDEVVADLPRPDIFNEVLGSVRYGFELTLPDEVFPRSGTVKVHIKDHDVVLERAVDRVREYSDALCAPNLENSSEGIGAIDTSTEGRIAGWLFSPDPAAVPVIRVGGRFAEPVALRQPRPDVNEALGITGDTGYVFSVDWMRPSDIIELYVLTMRGLTLVITKQAGAAKLDENFYTQLSRVSAIAREENSVAVVCWDSAHNPIGRAKVLLDVVRTRRPAVLISYVFDEFGGRVWPPLRTLDIPILTIPWLGRGMYERALEVAGLKFDTVWLCKARLPTFQLAKVIAAPDARLILDYDDNEEHFSRSAGSKDKPYGLSAINLARNLSQSVTARTAASGTLCYDFDASLVRHAREQQDIRDSEDAGPLKVGFIGTVRAHKNALEAAKAIRIFALTTGVNIEYHVYGDFQSGDLIDELKANGAVVVDGVPMSELYQALAKMDVVLTGYHSGADQEITKYQISSKIGDALAVGKPVLVPDSPSVSDLANTPGVFLFNEATFPSQLRAALANKEPLCLPPEFTLDGAYETFSEVEAKAATRMRAADALALLPSVNDMSRPEPTVLLIWKQPDAGHYGRRVDQVARAYKTANPSSRVVILELIHQTTINHLETNASNRLSDHGALLNLSRVKQSQGIYDDGVILRQIIYSSSSKLATVFEEFLLDNLMLPTNTKIVAFPLIQFFEKILPILSSFPLIVDVVDNQISWPAKEPVRNKLMQYTSFFNSADVIVFNSEQNRQYFEGIRRVLSPEQSVVIPNWYTAPSTHGQSRQKPPGIHLIYSGNMHDRIDWSLMTKIADLGEGVILHLVGSADFRNAQFEYLLSLPQVIYHGPLAERQTLSLLSMMDLAVMPHEVDEISTYMNPLKVKMYAAAGVPAVATSVPGICPSEWVSVTSDHEEFMAKIRELVSQNAAPRRATDGSEPARAYVQLIDACGTPDAGATQEVPEQDLSSESDERLVSFA